MSFDQLHGAVPVERQISARRTRQTDRQTDTQAETQSVSQPVKDTVFLPGHARSKHD